PLFLHISTHTLPTESYTLSLHDALPILAYEQGTAREGTHLVVAEIMSADLPTEYFGGVFVSNFLEHLSGQETVAAFLEKMHVCLDRKSTRLNSSHGSISYAVFCLKKKIQ